MLYLKIAFLKTNLKGTHSIYLNTTKIHTTSTSTLKKIYWQMSVSVVFRWREIIATWVINKDQNRNRLNNHDVWYLIRLVLISSED